MGVCECVMEVTSSPMTRVLNGPSLMGECKSQCDEGPVSF